MGFSKAIVAIKGNYINKLEKVAELLSSIEEDDILDELAQNATFENGWTIIVDEEMLYVLEDDLLSNLSEELETEILTFVIQSTSATYGFSNFNEGNNRIFLIQDGAIIENSGEKINEERNIHVGINASMEDILHVATAFRIDLGG